VRWLSMGKQLTVPAMVDRIAWVLVLDVKEG
jgi:hypothetical protein